MDVKARDYEDNQAKPGPVQKELCVSPVKYEFPSPSNSEDDEGEEAKIHVGQVGASITSLA